MKPFRLLFAASIAACVAIAQPLRSAEPAPSVGGYWSGTLTLPNRELDFHFELIPGATWKGTIDIPAQGLRGFALDPLKVSGVGVEFGLPGIPGEPRFTGTLAADGKTIAGELTQGGGAMPFRVERKPKPAARAVDAPVAGVAGKGLAGNWLGALKPVPGIELRLALEVTAGAAGKAEGILISLDQEKARIPLEGLTEEAGVVKFATPSIRGDFSGKMNSDGSEIVGDWTQMGRSMALVFKRQATAKP